MAVGSLGARAVIETGSAYDLLVSSLLLAHPTTSKRFADQAEWRAAARGLGPGVAATLKSVGDLGVINLLGLASELPVRTAEALVARMAAMEPVELVLHAAGRYRRAVVGGVAADVIEAAVYGDPGARRAFMARSWPDVPDWQRTLRFLLGRPAADVAAAVAAAYASWHALAFAPRSAALAEGQAAEAEALLAESPSWRVDALLRRVTPTIEYVAPAGVDVVRFVPTTVARPLVLLLDHRTETIVVFSAIDRAKQSDAAERLERIGNALGDGLRLRALALIAAGPITIVDLAAKLAVPRTSLTHHVGVLRGAGLVIQNLDDGRWGRLALRREALDDLGPLLDEVIGSKPKS